jgi:hypothetical protein
LRKIKVSRTASHFVPLRPRSFFRRTASDAFRDDDARIVGVGSGETEVTGRHKQHA